MRKSLFFVLLVMSVIMTAVAPAMAQDDSSWRVRRVSDGSYGPELPLSRPGYGTSTNEVATVVGDTLTFKTADGEVTLDGGCNQAVVMPNVYARNAGGRDWGFVVWELNPAVTEANNEMAVLSWELAKQQVAMESCEDLPDTELLTHVYVVTQDPDNARLVVLTPFHEFRRSTGENHVLMIAPGDTFYGWHVGLGNSQDNLCDGGSCYLVQSPVWGFAGGGVINSTWAGEIPADARPITPARIRRIMRTLGS